MAASTAQDQAPEAETAAPSDKPDGGAKLPGVPGHLQEAVQHLVGADRQPKSGVKAPTEKAPTEKAPTEKAPTDEDQ